MASFPLAFLVFYLKINKEKAKRRVPLAFQIIVSNQPMAASLFISELSENAPEVGVHYFSFIGRSSPVHDIHATSTYGRTPTTSGPSPARSYTARESFTRS